MRNNINGIDLTPLDKNKSFIRQVNEYYPEYLKAHTNPWNKLVHVIGNMFVLTCTGFVLWYSVQHMPASLFALFLLPWITTKLIYQFAWRGHKYLEGNKPATWTVNKWITKACDWKMMFQLATLKLKWDTRPRMTKELIKMAVSTENDRRKNIGSY